MSGRTLVLRGGLRANAPRVEKEEKEQEKEKEKEEEEEKEKEEEKKEDEKEEEEEGRKEGRKEGRTEGRNSVAILAQAILALAKRHLVSVAPTRPPAWGAFPPFLPSPPLSRPVGLRFCFCLVCEQFEGEVRFVSTLQTARCKCARGQGRKCVS